MHCPSCNAECKIGTKFCPECGTALALRCPSCNAEYKPGAKFCGECGTALAKTAVPTHAVAPTALVPTSAPPPASPAPTLAPLSAPTSGERRQLTVMFCDVVNSTGLSENLDPEELRDFMHLFHETADKVIHRFDGLIAKYLGDGLLVHFGYPNAHEDDAQRAVRAGLGILEALKFSHFKTAAGRTIPIDIRIGIHTGLVVIDEIGAESQRKMDIVGETPNIAARLQSLAEPNTLIVSANTYHLIAGFFEEEYLGPQAIKGLSAQLEVYRILHESSARTRLQVRTSVGGLTPMVGRDAEIARLKDLWTNVVEGQGQTVLICGEAGIGKSRITDALKVHVAKEQDAWLTETECSPYHQNTAFHPVSQLMERTVLQFSGEDTIPMRYAKLEGFLAQYGYDVQETVPLLAPIVSLPPDPKYKPIDPLALTTRQKTMELLLNLLLRRASIQPLLYIIEDLHWADPSTLDLLGMIIAQTPGTRMMTYMTFRPEFKPPWVGEQNVQLMMLNKLGQGHTREMVTFLVENKKIPEAVAIQILNKTDGVPLFIEELTKAVLETGQLVQVGDHYETEGKVEEIAIPATLKDSLMARLDRLSTSKLVAQIAATIGREFSYQLLLAVSHLDDRVLQHELGQLTASGLIFQRGLPPNATYIFKHALIQDAAYDSLLKSRRQEIHRQINFIIKRDFPEVYTNQPETLAIHYAEGGMPAESVAEWLRAGQQATARFASQEAITDYSRALELLNTLPEDSPSRAYELPLNLLLGISLLMTKGYSAPEAGAALSRARELARNVPNAPEIPIILWSVWAFYVVRAEHDHSFALASELWKTGEERKDDVTLLEASFTLGLEHFLRKGDFKQAQTELNRVLDRYHVEKNSAPITGYLQDVLATSLSWAGWTEFILGNPRGAMEILERNLRHHRSLGHPYSSAYAGSCMASQAVLMEDIALAEEYGNESQKVAIERGYPFFLGMSFYVLGWAKGRQGNYEESMALFNQGFAIWNAMGAMIWRTLAYSWKAETQIFYNDFSGARETIDMAYAEIEKYNERHALSPIKRLEGDVILGLAAKNPVPDASGLSSQARAEELYREAIAIARTQSAKSFELPALMRLYDLLKGTPKGSDVLAQLTAVYESYSDGHDLPLLKRAKAMLDGAGVRTNGIMKEAAMVS